MTENYDRVAERLWEKLEYHRASLIKDCVDFTLPFPFDQFARRNPMVHDLVDEVQCEFDYEMSEFQGSWAVNAFLRWSMEDYYQKTGRRVYKRE